jgi:hypothetical protein
MARILVSSCSSGPALLRVDCDGVSWGGAAVDQPETRVRHSTQENAKGKARFISVDSVPGHREPIEPDRRCGIESRVDDALGLDELIIIGQGRCVNQTPLTSRDSAYDASSTATTVADGHLAKEPEVEELVTHRSKRSEQDPSPA